VISQLERLNSNETKIAPRSVWIAVNGSDLSATAFMVSSKMDGSDPHFDAKAIATHNTSWDLEKDDVQADPATCVYRLCHPNVVPMETAEPSD
jgi:hypothetical protein